MDTLFNALPDNVQDRKDGLVCLPWKEDNLTTHSKIEDVTGILFETLPSNVPGQAENLNCQDGELTVTSPYKLSQEDEGECANEMADTLKDRGLEIFILAGQSNMSGRGGMQLKEAADGYKYMMWDGVVPEECNAEPGSILRLTASLEWEEAHEPLHYDIDPAGPIGVGPGLVFAASLLRSHEAKFGKGTAPMIGLVPCAVGATSMSKWKKGSFLYNKMILRTKAAIQKGGTLKGLLWCQGESDTINEELGASFALKLATFLQDVRTDLQSNSFPIIQVGIPWAHHPHPKILKEVRQAQMAQANASEHVFIVDALGLPLQSDNVHLTTEAQTTLGLMLVEKLNSFTDSYLVSSHM